MKDLNRDTQMEIKLKKRCSISYVTGELQIRTMRYYHTSNWVVTSLQAGKDVEQQEPFGAVWNTNDRDMVEESSMVFFTS